MQHYTRAGRLEVDHFDPRRKKDLIQDYVNLFPASKSCNRKKWDKWPTVAEQAAGCRFLNPCEEQDYGEQIFEDPHTHLLIGTTPAAGWHIRICGLNADHLIDERRRRSTYITVLQRKAVRKVKAEYHAVRDLIATFRQEIDLMIPPIAPPPGTTGAAVCAQTPLAGRD